MCPDDSAIRTRTREDYDVLTKRRVQLVDFEPCEGGFLRDVLDGLGQTPKTLPCKYFYDERGSRLFDAICELDEYYLTRTEIAIMRDNGRAIGRAIGPGCCLVEFGSGSSVKTRLLLDHLDDPVACILIDISRKHLLESAAELADQYPDLQVIAVCADFASNCELPCPRRAAARRAVYFPGSTIGNFRPADAEQLLRRIARIVGRGGGLLIGADLKKDRETLERAYNDRAGVTSAFNLNLLHRINRELGADFDLDAFRHRATYNAAHGRIESHLVSRRAQTVRLNGSVFRFERGETIHTESSHKYSLDGFRALADRAGFDVQDVWTDERGLFSVQYLTTR
ncbi:MAG: L-histidine N(alpha)-methyltransferase [Planctomycetes bacterium]|nr:L-histidine N(alpha)-methyltransferase [Planctomycetota bacterium]